MRNENTKVYALTKNDSKIEFVDVVWPLAFWGRRHSGIPNRSQTSQSTSSLQDIWLRVGNQIRAVLARKTVADEFDVNTRPVNWDQARRACRDLRANLEEQRDYADAGDFYYSEMELRRRGLLREGIVGWFRWFLHSAYWLMCGYGERPLRAVCVFALACVLLSGAFRSTWFRAAEEVKWRTAEYSGKREFHPTWSESMSYTFRAMTFQKGGYILPFTPWATRLTLMANFLGPVQLGFMFLAMQKKFRR